MKKEAAMRMFLVVAAAAVIVAPSPARAGAQPRNPYANLFTAQLNPADPQKPTPPRPSVPPPSFSAPSQTVVCGLTIVHGQANVDPKMPQKPPAGAPKGAIKVMPAPMCQK
jgi:hypothetical protein